MSKKKILSELIIDEEAVLNELVKKSKNLIAIGGTTGEVFLRCDKTKLGNKDLVFLNLLGIYFSYEMDLIDNKYIDRKNLSKMVGTSENVISARISDLRKENLVDSNNEGHYCILVAKVPEYLDIITEKLRK